MGTRAAHVHVQYRCVRDIACMHLVWTALACLTWSTPRSGAPPDSHQDPQTSVPVLPNRDYTTGHVETPLRAYEHNWLPIPPGQAGKTPTDDLGLELCRRGARVAS